MPNLMFAPKRVAEAFFGALMSCTIGAASLSAQTAQPNLPARVAMPDNAKITLLIQTHIAALSHANLTGNYAILHAMASPAFQSLNSPAQLAQKFAAFRTQGIDVGPAILLPPILSGPPSLEGADLLRVSGHYETKPQRVVFDMAFQAVNNAWRLAGIAVSTVAPQAAEQPHLEIQIPKSAKSSGPAKH
jgi:hypothetical protein